MANFLVHNPSLNISQINLETRNLIHELNETVVTLRGFGDSVCSHLLDEHPEIADFYQYACIPTSRVAKYNWMEEREFSTLLGLLNILFQSPPHGCLSLNDLDAKFTNVPNAYAGFDCQINRLVGTIRKWNELHVEFVSRFTFQEQIDRFDYFNRFYRPKLKKPFNQIAQQIKTGGVHNSITRIDKEHVDHNVIHVHFIGGENNALGISGVWHHLRNDSFRIPKGAQQNLVDWGFRLPKEYYRS